MQNNNQDMVKRVVLATVVSFLFFLGYDYFVMQPNRAVVAEQNKQLANQNNNSTQQAVDKHMAPQVKDSSSAPAVSSAPVEQKEIIATISSDKYIAQIDKLGRIAQWSMTEERYLDANGMPMELFDNFSTLKALEVRFSDSKVNKEAFSARVNASVEKLELGSEAKTITLTQNLSAGVLTKKITFYPDGHYDVEINSPVDSTMYISTGKRPNVEADMYTNHGAMIKQVDNTLQLVEDGDWSGTQTFQGVKFASAFDRYYSSVIYNFDNLLEVVLGSDKEENPEIYIVAKKSFSASGYIGPKDYETLHSINPELTDVIEYGWFTFIANPVFLLLKWIYDYIGNWGWSIVILTILTRVVLYPLTYKGMVSMQKLKDLAPKIKELQEKHKGNPQKSSAAMMELYKKHGANPMGGCLPLLLQIPVFFAVYRVLMNAIELKGAEWILWIEDLSVMDPYFVLPVLMGATMYIQQVITPNTMTDPMQQKIFKFLPVIFTFFFITFPAGLTLYWFVNNSFSVVQQWYVNKKFETMRALKANKE